MNLEPIRSWFSWGRVACLVFSGVALWIVYHLIDPGALKKAFLNLRPGWFLGSLCLFGLCCLLATRRWHKLLRMNGCDTHPGATFRAVLIGHFFNTLLFGPAGGDIAKSAMYGRWYRYPTSEILAASFLDRLLGGGGAVLFGLFAVGLALVNGAFDVWDRIWASLPGWWMWAGLVVLLFGLWFLTRHPLKGESPLAQTLNAMASGAHRLSGNLRLAASGLWLGFLVQIFWSGTLALNLQAITHGPVPWWDLLWTFPVISLLSAVPVSVAGAGVREGSALMLLGAYGIPRTEAVAAAMLTLVVYLFWAAIGGLLLWRESRLGKRYQQRKLPQNLSVVIPVLNEAESLPDTLKALKNVPEICEVIVVDGGSDDGSRELAGKWGCTVLTSQPGRGIQLRSGAVHGSGDVILLLHADTWLPPDAGQAALRCLRDVTVAGGGFWKVFRHPSWIMAGSRWRCGFRLFAGHRIAGDQAIFVRRECLEAIGGVPDVPLMEEFVLCRRLRSQGRLALAGATVSTSMRRFTRLGVLRTYARMWHVFLLYLLGREPEQLRRIYEKDLK